MGNNSTNINKMNNHLTHKTQRKGKMGGGANNPNS